MTFKGTMQRGLILNGEGLTELPAGFHTDRQALAD